MTILDLLLKPLRAARVTERYPGGDTPPARGIRGTPVLDDERCDREGACLQICPTRAITLSPASEWRLDYGLCIFCGECIRACPTGAIIATDSFELAQVRRVDVIAVGEGKAVDHA